MDKSKTKKQNRYNQVGIIALSKRYGVSKRYVRMCLKGDRHSLKADDIRADYKVITKEVEAIINKE